MIDNLDGARSTLRLLAWQALKTYPVDALLKLLDDDDYIVRTAVARELQIRDGPATFSWALRHLEPDNKVYQREIAAFILGQLGTPNLPFRELSIPLLTEVLKNESSEDVRAAAAAALGHLRATSATSLLIEATRDSSPDVRACAAVALGALEPTEDVRRAVSELLLDEAVGVRNWAQVAIEMLDGQEPV